MINSFSGENRFLSNFYPSPFNHKGKFYATVEHAFQASKAITEEDHELIRREQYPQGAKTRGRLITIREDWEKVKVDFMREFLILKFFNNKDLRQKLLDTGEQELVEGNYWHDRIWGKCTCSRHNNEGQNLLGILLMEVRETYKTSY